MRVFESGDIEKGDRRLETGYRREAANRNQ